MPRLPGGRRTTLGAALIAVAVLAGSGLWLETRTARRFEAAAEAATSGADPVELLVAAGRAHRLLFIGGVAGARSPVVLAAEVTSRLARSVGVDVVILDVGEDQQPVIDRYLRRETGEAELMASPRAAGGGGLPLLPLLSAIRQLNQDLGAARSIRIIAAGPADWPPERAMSPAAALARWSGIDAHMSARIEERVFTRDPRARAILLVDGLHALRVPFVVRTGGTPPVTVTPLAAILAGRNAREVWTALIDPAAAPPSPVVAAYAGTAARETLRRSETGGSAFGLAALDRLGPADDWLRVATAPGLQFDLATARTTFAAVTDAYVYIPN